MRERARGNESTKGDEVWFMQSSLAAMMGTCPEFGPTEMWLRVRFDLSVKNGEEMQLILFHLISLLCKSS